MTLGNLLKPSTDWKQTLLEQGEELAKQQVQNLWRTKVSGRADAIAAAMQRDGFTWENASDVDWVHEHGIGITPAEFNELGAGFVLSRDALYRILKETGLPGGATRDAWRDGADNAVFAAIKDRVSASTPLVEVVTLTLEEMIRHTL